MFFKFFTLKGSSLRVYLVVEDYPYKEFKLRKISFETIFEHLKIQKNIFFLWCYKPTTITIKSLNFFLFIIAKLKMIKESSSKKNLAIIFASFGKIKD